MPTDAAVGDERQVESIGRPPALEQRLQLRHAKAGRDTRRAAAAGADADLHRVDATLAEELHAVGGGHVSGDQLDLGEAAA